MFGALIRRKASALPPPAAAMPERLAASTVFSLTTEVPRPVDGRADPATAHLLPVGRLLADEGQTLCRIRAITAGGLVADVHAEVAVGTPVRVEIHSDQSISGQIVWVRDGAVGIRFDAHADIRDFLPRSRINSGMRARPARLEIRCGATVRIGKICHRAEVRDISLGGIKLALPDAAAIGKKVVVTVESLRPLAGTVSWHKGAQAGITWDKPLQFEELAQWLAQRTEFACLKAGAWARPAH